MDTVTSHRPGRRENVLIYNKGKKRIMEPSKAKEQMHKFIKSTELYAKSFRKGDQLGEEGTVP